MTTCTIKMNFNLVDRELNWLHVGIEVSFIRASLCACAAKLWNLIRKAFNICSHNLIPNPIVLDGIEALISNTSRMVSPKTPYILFGCGDVGGRKVKFGVSLSMIVLWVGENCISEWRCR